MMGLGSGMPPLRNGVGDHRHDLILHEQEAIPDAVVIDPVVQAARVAAFVDVAAGDIAEGTVLDHEGRHGCSVDSGERAHAAEIVAGAHLDLAGVELGDRFVAILGKTFEQGAADDRIALAAAIVRPGHRRPGGEMILRGKPATNSPTGRTSIRTGSDLVRRSKARRLASVVCGRFCPCRPSRVN